MPAPHPSDRPAGVPSTSGSSWSLVLVVVYGGRHSSSDDADFDAEDDDDDDLDDDADWLICMKHASNGHTTRNARHVHASCALPASYHDPFWLRRVAQHFGSSGRLEQRAKEVAFSCGLRPTASSSGHTPLFSQSPSLRWPFCIVTTRA